ncbi:MAG TPA: 16S rRNA (cytosine(967)-C(5))-methyltransferase RsmB [Bacillota bacterium]|nr:16S rRNA (cytosine(967)-C(5))-methyltransferase RsmB [Bacillota bacterium]HOK63986.1 16S rRNA (cytosine(967)-C(5))-methyltransferase RsmB [Bacillota bacterium]HOL11341.1 16S rRNA (cytosine(967)-C(5))-methyltransferase RsmB [Bacillota bacterium]HOQ02470.1 16S rRNA (cytosine(967)-C(5))-methyltransferase RsmB [Bacillota bacterium]HPP60173.1 16S rRNA (cytosine(967)-C(5))-methyltransferase RsmB [Bacillota bacterium]
MPKDARRIALEILDGHRFSPSVLTYADSVDQRNRALVKELVAGVNRWKRLLDYYISHFSDRPISKLSSRVLNALRLGVYQLVFMGIPPYAAVDSVVRCMKNKGERSFVNAVLRTISRSMGHIELPSIDEDPLEYAGLRYSFPDWIVTRYFDYFGFRDGFSLLKYQNVPPPITLRVNTTKTDRDRLIRMFQRNGYLVELGKLPISIKVKKGRAVEDFPGYDQGLFTVQDEGAMAVSLVLDPQPDDLVWDVCAAPGGKSVHLAELMHPSGMVVASDISAERINMIDETSKRLGLNNVCTVVLDATDPQQVKVAFREKGLPVFYDKILVDAPCSGLGTISKNPDIKWSRQESDVKRLARLQQQILQTAVGFLKPGGVLVYSTCTLTSEENQGVWCGFVEDQRIIVETPLLPEGLRLDRRYPEGSDAYVYLLPHIHETDGFFIAKGRLPR